MPKQNKLMNIVVTLLIIGLLIFIGPVDALFLKLDGFKNTPYDYGEKVNFIGKIEINSNEVVNLKNIGIEVNDEIVCTFRVNGNLISNCSGFNVSLVSNSANFGYGYGYDNFNIGWNGSNRSNGAGNYNGYGYGYGYGYSGDGELVYNISVQTPQDYFKIPGNNDLKLVAHTGKQTFNSRTEKIVIQPANSGNGGNSGGGGRNNKPGSEESGRINNNSSVDKNQLLSNPVKENLEKIFGINNLDADSNDEITGAGAGNFNNSRYMAFALFLFALAITVSVVCIIKIKKALRSY